MFQLSFGIVIEAFLNEMLLIDLPIFLLHSENLNLLQVKIYSVFQQKVVFLYIGILNTHILQMIKKIGNKI